MVNSLPVLNVPELWGGDTGAQYTDLLITTYGASEVWRLVDMTSTPIIASVATARNGTATGWDLTAPNAIASPVAGEGRLAPYSDGTNDIGNIYSASLAAIFNGSTGGVFAWAYMGGDWATATIRTVLMLGANTSTDFLYISKSAANTLTWWFEGNNNPVNRTDTYSGSIWFSVAMTYNVTSNRVRAFLNGAKVGADIAGPQAISGLGANYCALGSLRGDTPLNPWIGNLAYVAVRFGAEWSEADIAGMHAGAG